MTQLNDAEIKFRGSGGGRTGTGSSQPQRPSRGDRDGDGDRDRDRRRDRYHDYSYRDKYYLPYWRRVHPFYDDYYSNYNRYYYPRLLNYTLSSPFIATINSIVYSYPVYPTLYDIERMKLFILDLPNFVPCQTNLCKNYVQNYVNNNKDNLNSITSSKAMLIDFFNDFIRDVTNKFNTEIIATESNYRFNGII